MNGNSNLCILLNGEYYLIKFPITINEFLGFFYTDKKQYIVEYNQKILSKSLFDEIFLKAYDKLELLTIVGGG